MTGAPPPTWSDFKRISSKNFQLQGDIDLFLKAEMTSESSSSHPFLFSPNSIGSGHVHVDRVEKIVVVIVIIVVVSIVVIVTDVV